MSVQSLVLVWLCNELIYRETFEFKLKIWICIISRVSDMHSRVWIFSICGIVWNTFPREDLAYDYMFHKCMLFPSFHLAHFDWRHYAIFVFFLWMWDNHVQHSIQSLLFVGRGSPSSCGCTITFCFFSIAIIASSTTTSITSICFTVTVTFYHMSLCPFHTNFLFRSPLTMFWH